MGLPFWEYKICDAKVKITNEGSLFSPIRDGYWTLIIDDSEYGLQEGLAKLGEKGWELAGIQTVRTDTEPSPSSPESFYVFKRPI